MTQDQHSIEGLMALVSEYGQCRWSEGSSGATHLDRMGEKRSREEAADLYKQIESYAAHLQQRPLPVREGTERDAARYRWLRDTGYWYTSPKGSPWAVIGTGAGDAMPCCGQELDAAIDAGMADMPPVAPSLPVRQEPTPLPRELMESCLAAAQEATFQGFDASLLKDSFVGRQRRLLETLYRMGFESGWRIREKQSASPSVQNMGEGETGKDGVGGPLKGNGDA